MLTFIRLLDLLNRFKQPKLARLSSTLIIFSLLIKMIMPIAHASTAVTGEKTGFFAALCTANGVVLINAEQASKESNQQPPQINSNNVCPLCLLVDQGLYDSTTLHTTLAQRLNFDQHFVTYFSQPAVDGFNPKHLPIRAPPAFS